MNDVNFVMIMLNTRKYKCRRIDYRSKIITLFFSNRSPEMCDIVEESYDELLNDMKAFDNKSNNDK